MMKGTETLREIQNSLDAIYGSVNKSFSIEELLVRLDENAGYLFQSIEANTDSDKWLIKSLSWLIACCLRLDIDVQTVLLQRYPGVCPHCINESCICDRTNKLPSNPDDLSKRQENLNALYNIKLRLVESGELFPNLDELRRMLTDIYYVNVSRWKFSRYYFFAKLTEERAEIIECYRRFKITTTDTTSIIIKNQLGREFADYLAWLIAIWSLLHKDETGYSIQYTYTQRYSAGCPYCHSTPCACSSAVRLGVRGDSELIATGEYVEDVTVELRKQLELLAGILKSIPEFENQAKELEESAKTSPDKEAVFSKLGTIQRMLSVVDRSSAGISNLAIRVTNLIEWVDKSLQ